MSTQVASLTLCPSQVNEEILNAIEALIRQVSFNLGEDGLLDAPTLAQITIMREEIGCGPFTGPFPS